MPTYFCKECDGNGYQQDGWDESDDAEERRRRARARREQRRSRKAAKNLVMYKTAGRRPWTRPPRAWSHDVMSYHVGLASRAYSDLSMRIYETNETHARIMAHLRNRSGFAAMSRLASMLVDHELQSSTVCDRCNGAGKGKSRDGQWICLKCNGFGHAVVLHRRAEATP